MTVRIRVARTTSELDSLFRLRHRVFVEQEGYMPARPDGRINDQWDAFPTTANVVGVVDEHVVAAVRVAAPSEVGLPADAYFDFAPYTAAGGERTASISLVCADREYRHTPRLTMSIMAMASYWAISEGMTHIVAPCNPDVEHYFARMGFVPLAEKFFDAEKGLSVLPMILDLNAGRDAFLSFVWRQKIDHFMSSFDRQFHVAGEVVMRKGEPGDSAYVVVEGEAAVVLEGEDPSRAVARLAPGDVFGELALLTDRPRTASVIATADLDLMALDRNVFLRQIDENPAAARAMLHFLGNRLADALASLNAG